MLCLAKAIQMPEYFLLVKDLVPTKMLKADRLWEELDSYWIR
jgi:hypothetical protein